MNLPTFTDTPDPSDSSPASGSAGAYGQLGLRLAEAVAHRVDSLAPTSTVRLAPYSALRRKAERVRNTRRFAIAAVTGAVAITAGIAVGTGVFGGDNEIELGTNEPPTPEEQAAATVGRYAPTFVPDDLTLQSVMYQGSATIEPVDDTWVQVFAPETADLAHPGLLVSTTPPPDVDFYEYGEELTVGGHPAWLVTSASGALQLDVERPDAVIRFFTIDFTRADLLAIAASAIVEPGRRGVALEGLPVGWSQVVSQIESAGPQVALSYRDDDVMRQLSVEAYVSPAWAGFEIRWAAEPVILADGAQAQLFRSSDGSTAISWLAADGVRITIFAYQLDETEVLAVADSVRSLDPDEWDEVVASAKTVENYLRNDPSADAQQTATTAATPVVALPGSGPNWQDAGFDLDELPVGSWRTAGEYSGPWLVARIDDDTLVGVLNSDANLAGTCYILPVGASKPIPFGSPVATGTVADPDRPGAAVFVNDCTGATYSLNGDVVSGSAVGLTTIPVRITAEGRVEYAPDKPQAGRPAAA